MSKPTNSDLFADCRTDEPSWTADIHRQTRDRTGIEEWWQSFPV